ncbi:MAG: zinc-dependent metalloprotease, partial [Actinomycetota bacterium]|nr:zinc-dependent metalloprotease [Actinomycetota bacterium]
MSQDPYDIPLFRELQKILASSEGPINLEIARQVANALNQDAPTGGDDTAATRALRESVHAAEVLVSGYTRLALDEPARSEVIDRRAWVTRTLGGWNWLLVQLAQRFSDLVTGFATGRGDEVNPMGAVMGQIAPLLLGMQAGTLVGQVARESLGRYDPPIPRDDDGHLFFVGTNMDRVASEYGFEVDTFRRWLALHDVSRHAVMSANPWVGRYRRSLFTELVQSLEIDASDLERRLEELQTRGAEALQEGMGGGEMLPIVPTDRHTRARDRLRAFISVLDGYAHHASVAVADTFVGETPRIEEGMRRRAATPSEGAALLEATLGLTFDPTLEQSGATFCAAIVELHGIDSLNRVWEAPDN